MFQSNNNYWRWNPRSSETWESLNKDPLSIALNYRLCCDIDYFEVQRCTLASDPRCCLEGRCRNHRKIAFQSSLIMGFVCEWSNLSRIFIQCSSRIVLLDICVNDKKRKRWRRRNRWTLDRFPADWILAESQPGKKQRHMKHSKTAIRQTRSWKRRKNFDANAEATLNSLRVVGPCWRVKKELIIVLHSGRTHSWKLCPELMLDQVKKHIG